MRTTTIIVILRTAAVVTMIAVPAGIVLLMSSFSWHVDVAISAAAILAWAYICENEA